MYKCMGHPGRRAESRGRLPESALRTGGELQRISKFTMRVGTSVCNHGAGACGERQPVPGGGGDQHGEFPLRIYRGAAHLLQGLSH